jgi:hypothetical protein
VPDDFDLRLRLDGALAARGRFDEIVAMWDAFIDAHPDHARAWQERGGANGTPATAMPRSPRPSAPAGWVRTPHATTCRRCARESMKSRA